MRYGNSRCILETVSPVSFTGVMQRFVNGELRRYQSVFTRPRQQTPLRMEQATLPAMPAQFLPTNNPRLLLNEFRDLEEYMARAIRRTTRTGDPLTVGWRRNLTPFVGGTLARRAVEREFREMFASTAGLGEPPNVRLNSIMSQIEVRSECCDCMSRHTSEISFVFPCCGAHYCMECVVRRLRYCIGRERLATCTVDEYDELLENLQCSVECEEEFYFDDPEYYEDGRGVGEYVVCSKYGCGHKFCEEFRDKEEEMVEDARKAQWREESD